MLPEDWGRSRSWSDPASPCCAQVIRFRAPVSLNRGPEQPEVLAGLEGQIPTRFLLAARRLLTANLRRRTTTLMATWCVDVAAAAAERRAPLLALEAVRLSMVLAPPAAESTAVAVAEEPCSETVEQGALLVLLERIPQATAQAAAAAA